MKKATNIGDGIKQGVWGIGSEVVSGVSGFFSKPVQGAK